MRAGRLAISPSERIFMRRSNLLLSSGLSVTMLVTGCAGPHVEITRMMGMFPPNAENRSDFYEDAKERCKEFKQTHPQCIAYWEAVLWAQDYRDYVGARAVLNRNVIYWAGIVALASAGALVGLAAFGSTNSDAYKIIPIAGSFLSGVLTYSKNDALYEAYEIAGKKIDQSLRSGREKTDQPTPTNYSEAAAAIRRDVGSAIDELTQKRIEIVKFQSKSEADQFNAVRDAAAARDLNQFRLISVSASPAQPNDPTKIIAVLDPPPDSQKIPPAEMRLKLTDSKGATSTLRISGITGAEVTAEIPPELLNHGPRSYLVEVQAQNGNYPIKDSKTVPLIFSQVRLEVKVTGAGSVSYTDTDGKTVTCSPTCDTGLIPTATPTQLTATPPSGGPNTYTWKNVPASCTANTSPCDIRPSDDTTVEVTFP
jgi:hypothetical protein